MIAHKHTIQKTNAIYPIKNSVVKVFPIQNNSLIVSPEISDSFIPAMTDALYFQAFFFRGMLSKNR